MSETQEYIIRTQSDRAYTYGLGKVVSPGVSLFERGFYGLTRDRTQRQAEIAWEGGNSVMAIDSVVIGFGFRARSGKDTAVAEIIKQRRHL